jgi:chaperonin cofactor prefoldin
MDLDIKALAAQIEETCSTLENEITALKQEKHRINTQIKAKQDELDVAKSMRPRKKRVPTAAPAAE